MKRMSDMVVRGWMRLGSNYLPFADAVTPELPFGALFRLSLFQVTVGMAVVLLTGTLNRVMIIELNVPAWLVALMVSLPLVFAPFRALIGFKSDTHRSFLGWKRVPYIWMGTLLQFGGFAIMPFALLVLSGTGVSSPVYGQYGAALAFLLVGAGLHTTQTAGLALATDIAPEESRPQVVALLYVMLLVGMVFSSLVFGALLENFSQKRLIQVIQGAAVVTMVLNLIALWKQEARDPAKTSHQLPRPAFRESWRELSQGNGMRRLLVVIALGTAAFSMQDILLEPYGAEILGLSVSGTTILTALMSAGALVGFMTSATLLGNGFNVFRLAGLGVLIGIVAFTAIIFAAPMLAPDMFRIGTMLIGVGGGMFAIATLTAAMSMGEKRQNGLALGAWGAVQATAAGVAIALGGAIRDIVSAMAENGSLGPALDGPVVGYGSVYYLEIILLFATLVAIGPLVSKRVGRQDRDSNFGLAQFPG